MQQRHGQGQSARVSGRGRRRRVQGQGGREPWAHSQMGGSGGGRMADTWVLGVQLLGKPQPLGHRVMVQLEPIMLEAGQETGHRVAEADGQRFLGRWRAFIAAHDPPSPLDRILDIDPPPERNIIPHSLPSPFSRSTNFHRTFARILSPRIELNPPGGGLGWRGRGVGAAAAEGGEHTIQKDFVVTGVATRVTRL